MKRLTLVSNVTSSRLRVPVGLAVAATALAGLAALLGGSALADGPTRFAASMPRGALVYVEARDLSKLLGAWVASPTRQRYYESASYRSFRRSKLSVKLRDRLADLEAGFGFALTEERLASFAGGPSAFAVYDPGKLEVLFVTEVPRQQAEVAKLLASTAGFEERRTAGGAPFRVRQVTTDGGRLTQEVAVAYLDGRLWLTTTAPLLAEALDGPKDGGLATAVGATAKAAAGFEAHDVVIWVDQEKVNRNKYFDLYWIQHNKAELSAISSGIIDLELVPEGVRERRWFVLNDGPPAAGADAGALDALRALAPADAQLVEARAGDERLPAALAETMFGDERRGDSVARVTPSRDSAFDDEDPEESDTEPAVGRYRHLDDRFRKDVDDPAEAAPARAATAAGAPALAPALAGLLAPAAPRCYATYASIDLSEGQSFAGFRSGVIVELGAPERLDTAALEALVSAEFGRRFVVGGDPSRAVWTGSDGPRQVAGALIPQGGAYRLAGRYLVVARSAAEVAEIASRAAAAPESRSGGTAVRAAEVRVIAGRESFRRFTRVLDARAAAALDAEAASGDDEAEGATPSRPVLFFSENVASLLDVARDLDRVRVTTAREGALLREEVDYVWATSPAPSARPPVRPAAKSD